MKQLVLFVVLLYYATDSDAAIKFTFLPSNYIEIGQLAPYHCSVNDTRVGINWFINGSTVLPSDVNVTGAGSSSSSLTIPGLPQYNNTGVKCAATGYLDNNVRYDMFNESTLRIQGKL